MDKSTSWERAQCLYEQNQELETKRQKSAEARIPSDPNAWYQIRENYEAIILEDHAFSEKHAIEYSLWQLHYRRIEEFRAHFAASQVPAHAGASTRGRNTLQADRTMKIRVQFKNFLSEATGFYHELIVKICSKYALPLAQLSGDLESHVISGGDGAKSSVVYKGLVSCHRCLIYLGDLARYKALYGENGSRTRDFTAASRYYSQAASILPSSGNPYNQLAILASYSGDDLATIYHYVRSLAAESPFTNAKDNLVTAFEKNRYNYTQQLRKVPTSQANENGDQVAVKSTKGNYQEFCVKFVRMNGMLFTRTSLEAFPEVLSSVKSLLHEFLSFGPEEKQNFGVGSAENRLAVLRVVAILIFTFQNVNRKTESLTYAETLQHTLLLQNAFCAIFELMGVMLERILQLRDPSSSFILPGLLSFLEWLAISRDFAAHDDNEQKPKAAKLMFWKHCITFLNKLLSDGLLSIDDDSDDATFTEMAKYEEGESESRRALWEDFELRGFLPLVPAHTILDFSRRHSASADGSNQEKITRLKRILAAGKALMNVVVIDKQPVHFDSISKQFVVGIEPRIFSSAMPDSYIENGSLNPGVRRAKSQLFYDEGEEDNEEEIVFRPSLADKLIDGSGFELAPPGRGDLRFHKAQPDARTNLGIPVGNDAPQRHMATELHRSPWLVQQQDFVSNSFKSLNLVGNEPVVKSESRGLSTFTDFGPTMPAFKPSINFNNGDIHSGHTRAPEAGLSSQADSLGFVRGIDVAMNTVPMAPATSKYQTSRPIRHLGPPPGFSSVPQKQIHAPVPTSDGRNERLLMEDFSEVHGRQLPSMGNGNGPIKDVNHPRPSSTLSISNNTVSTLFGDIPFPGEQVHAILMQGLEDGGQQNYQPFENLNLGNVHNIPHQQNLVMGDQQFSSLPQHYYGQGQTTWNGRYHV